MSHWQEYTDATSGRKYYYNTITKETTWNMPESFSSPIHEPVPQQQQQQCVSEVIAVEDSNREKNAFSLRSQTAVTLPIVIPNHIRAYSVAGHRSTSQTFFPTAQNNDSTLTIPRSTEPKRRSFSALPFLNGASRPTFGGSSSANTPVRATLPKHASGHVTLVTYGNEHFTPVRRGLFKSIVKTEKMLEFSKKPLTAPLHKNILGDAMVGKALRCFEVLQLYMQDKKYKDASPLIKQTFKTENEASSINLIRDMMTTSLQVVQLRDELTIYICKQCTKNPGPADNVLRGIQLLALMLASFPPAKLDLQEAILYFLQTDLLKQPNADKRVHDFAVLAEKRLRRALISGPRKTIPSDHEMRSITSLHPPQPIFGVTIDEYMQWQNERYPNVDKTKPYVLVVLLEALDAINGIYTEGLFRLPGNTQKVEELKDKFLTGNFTLEGKQDAHVLASVFKLWLRELAEPIIPHDMYNSCIEVAMDMQQCIDIISYLPQHNAQILAFVIRFLARMCDEKVQEYTKMTIENLAVVFSPNILRNQSTDPMAIMRNSQAEKLFVKNLINWKLGKSE
jgi:hypothetical protein